MCGHGIMEPLAASSARAAAQKVVVYHWSSCGGSRSCRVRLISRYLSQAACVVYISRSSVFKSSFLALLQPSGPDRTHTCLTLSHDYGPGQLFTLHEAAATAAPETGALHAASRHGRSIRLPSPAYTASTASLSPYRWWARESARADVNWYGADRNCGRRGTTPVETASRPRPGTAC